MFPLRWIGAAVLILGIALLLIPIPHRERHGFQVGDVTLGVVTQSEDKLPVGLSIVTILSGLVVLVVGAKQGS